MESKPIVTIGLCVRNCASTIKETIESILNQDYPRELMEIIFVDDGSVDETFSIIKEYASKTGIRIKIFRHKWKGLGPSRNVIVNNAKGTYIVWVDGDMKLSKDYLKSQVEFMENNLAVGIAKGKYGLNNYEGYVSFLENVPFFVFTNKYAGKFIEINPGTGGSIYRVKAIREIGGFNNQIKGAYEDIDVESRIREKGWLICISHATFYEKYPSTWKDLWKKYFWYGYGAADFYNIRKGEMKLYYMFPLAAFLSGLLYSFDAYRLTRRKIVFLLPIQFIYKMSAWWLGFIKNYANYHRRNHSQRN
ncbi:MAG: glycosyltransferase [Candidatus Aenigmatarchaeota archaeon]